MTYYGGADLARSFRTVRGNTLVVAGEIPEDKYDFRPAPECRSVKELLAHMVVSSSGTYQGHAVRKVTTFVGLDLAALIRDRLAQERELHAASKAQILEALKADGEQWGAYLDRVPEEELAVVIPFFPGAVPPAKSRFEMLLGVKEHEMHHRAQLMVYQRLLGLVPHLTRERQARSSDVPRP